MTPIQQAFRVPSSWRWPRRGWRAGRSRRPCRMCRQPDIMWATCLMCDVWAAHLVACPQSPTQVSTQSCLCPSRASWNVDKAGSGAFTHSCPICSHIRCANVCALSGKRLHQSMNVHALRIVRQALASIAINVHAGDGGPRSGRDDKPTWDGPYVDSYTACHAGVVCIHVVPICAVWLLACICIRLCIEASSVHHCVLTAKPSSKLPSNVAMATPSNAACAPHAFALRTPTMLLMGARSLARCRLSTRPLLLVHGRPAASRAFMCAASPRSRSEGAGQGAAYNTACMTACCTYS